MNRYTPCTNLNCNCRTPKPIPRESAFPSRAQRKADQEWELAGCARRDGDSLAELRHTEKARTWQRIANGSDEPEPV